MTPDLKSLLSRRIHWDDSLPGEPVKEPNPYREWGDLPLFVSIFDHSLSEEECAAEAFMFYADAVKRGHVAAYLEGERRFEAFYAELAREGAYVADGWRRGRRFLPASSGRLKRIVRDSLRERPGFRHMDMVFAAASVRVIGGHDRTDVLLPETIVARDEVLAAVRRHGLHVLP